MTSKKRKTRSMQNSQRKAVMAELRRNGDISKKYDRYNHSKLPVARHTMSKHDKIAGIKKALANPKTPPQFIANFKKKLKELENE